MKRNMDLARAILFEIETIPYDMNIHEIVIEGFSNDEINYHIMLLNEAGLVEALDLSSHGGLEWKSKRLTWKGHEFLDASRNETIWNKAKSSIREKGLSLSFDLVYKVLIKMMSMELN
ncbi:MAG: DUF2513 domain-containing protein [Candidatus Izemoplasmatales bacterium]|nr:DUF2513 domain-containing protein [Candidatus Izemoplasmatales bacterium]